jgi:hypothetical protein
MRFVFSSDMLGKEGKSGGVQAPHGSRRHTTRGSHSKLVKLPLTDKLLALMMPTHSGYREEPLIIVLCILCRLLARCSLKSLHADERCVDNADIRVSSRGLRSMEAASHALERHWLDRFAGKVLRMSAMSHENVPRISLADTYRSGLIGCILQFDKPGPCS